MSGEGLPRSTPLPVPELFVDNQGSNTLGRAFSEHVSRLREERRTFSLDLCAAFFNLAGFRVLQKALERVGPIRLLLGAEPKPEALREPPAPGEVAIGEREPKEVAEAIADLERGLRRERDLLPFDRESDAAVRQLLELLRNGQIESRLYRRRFLHAKAYLFRQDGKSAFVGSSNLTYSGMQGNLELNLGVDDPRLVPRLEAWFDDLWQGAESFDLASIYDRLLAEYPPYLIFLRVLWELYHGELEEEREDTKALHLTGFQQHGVWRAMRILRKYHGVLVADGVGLGKTFLAGEVIRHYRANKHRVVVVCPAALRDATWKKFLDRYVEWNVQIVSFEQLAEQKAFGGGRTDLIQPLDEYGLVVVDEAHNYRNPDAPQRAGILRRLLTGRRPDLLLLTATPVNNSLWDLYHALHFFLRQDACFADAGVISLRGRFAEAMQIEPGRLSPDHLYPVLDRVTVKRTRQFIKKHYAGDTITFPDGRRLPIEFPKPVARSIRYDLEKSAPGLLDQVEAALLPPAGAPRLTLARYQPEIYRRKGAAQDETVARQAALAGLLRSGLLKRFESSVAAFAATLERMVTEHDRFLAGLDRGVVATKELLREVAASDDEDEIEELFGDRSLTEPASNFDVKALRADIEADRAILEKLARVARRVRPESDPKLLALVEELAVIAEEAKREAATPEEEREKRKVLVFSAYVDTIDWIEAFLARALERDARLAPYRGRMVSVEGARSRRGVTREAAIEGFSPWSAGNGSSEEKFDLLLSTDVLAEGMNLQQCRHIVNFDLPWNPMRLVQRHGRIDRIGSPHRAVFLRTYFPDRQLDRLLKLEARVRDKLAQAAASIGVETSPIVDGAVGEQAFSESRAEIERLAAGDARLFEAGGTASAAQSGEEYRQLLRRELGVKARRDEIESLPWKAGSGLARGADRGHLFCARIGKRVYLRFVHLDAVGTERRVDRELASCLRRIECVEDEPRVLPDELRLAAFDAWEVARADIHKAWTVETDPRNFQPKIPKLNAAIAAHLRKFRPADLTLDKLDGILERVEAPCSERDRRALRDVFESPAVPSDVERSRALIAKVEELGLERVELPDALPPVQLEDVHLVCWMAVEKCGA